MTSTKTTLPAIGPDATPTEIGARLRELLDAGLPSPPKSGKASAQEAATDHREAVRRHVDEVAVLRQLLADGFAEERDWRPTTAPLATKELARRAAPGGNWHKPAREWPSAFRHPTFFRDAGRRAAGMTAHVIAEEIDREAVTAWAIGHALVATFPDFPSWQEPGRAFLAVLEPAEPVERAAAVAPSASVEKRDIGGATTRATKPENRADLSTERDPVPSSSDTVDDTHPDPAPSTAPSLPEMRPVAPIELDGVEPRDLTEEVGPDFDLVAPTDLLVDASYQRGLSPRSLALIRRIVRTWSWAKFKPPVCARVDGRLHVLDGQHTAIGAATHGGITIIPVVVVAVPEIADRAAAFVSHATDRLQTTAIQVHRAAVVAGDEMAVTIENVCRNAGATLLTFAPSSHEYRPRETVALAGIRRLVDKRGAMRARQIIEALANADLAPITGDHLRIGEALLLDPDYAEAFDAERLTTTMRGLTAKVHAEARELAIAKRIPPWRALVAVLYRNSRKAKPKSARQAGQAPEGADVGDAA